MSSDEATHLFFGKLRSDIVEDIPRALIVIGEALFAIAESNKAIAEANRLIAESHKHIGEAIESLGKEHYRTPGPLVVIAEAVKQIAEDYRDRGRSTVAEAIESLGQGTYDVGAITAIGEAIREVAEGVRGLTKT